MDELWLYVKDCIYKTDEKWGKIGLEKGLTGYYSPNITKDELDVIDEFLEIVNISALNTRVIKVDGIFKVLIASANL